VPLENISNEKNQGVEATFFRLEMGITSVSLDKVSLGHVQEQNFSNWGSDYKAS